VAYIGSIIFVVLTRKSRPITFSRQGFFVLDIITLFNLICVGVVPYIYNYFIVAKNPDVIPKWISSMFLIITFGAFIHIVFRYIGPEAIHHGYLKLGIRLRKWNETKIH